MDQRPTLSSRANAPPPWRTHSLARTQTLASLALAVAGLLLVYGFRGFEGPGLSNERAGFLLGMLLLVGGCVVLLGDERQTIAVDARRRTITLERRSRWGTRRRVVLFKDVTQLSVRQQGDRESGTPFYYVSATLRGGAELALFHGFYDGALSRETMQARCDRLQALLDA